MKYQMRYNDILKQSPLNDFEWLKDEFFILFPKKPQIDKKRISINILGEIINIYNFYTNEDTAKIIIKTLDNLEKRYPLFF